MPFQIIEVAIGVSLLIFVHELGHFAAAKWAGVRVDAFSIGFGPVLFGFKRGDTDYRISAIPLGGYVKMAGETVEDEREGKKDEFLSKTPGQRAVVFAAGVTMNTLFAFVAFAIAFKIGVSFMPMVVGHVDHGSAAWVARVEAGDEILSVNGKEIEDFEDFVPAVAFSEPGEILTLAILRDGKRIIKDVESEYDEYQGRPRIGLMPDSSLEIEEILEFDGKSPARDAGLRVRDRILEANGPVRNWDDLQRVLANNVGVPVQLRVEREGKTIETTVTPASKKRYMIGLSCQSARIKAVRTESPAIEAGLRRGDALTEVGGKAVRGWSDVIEAALASEKPSLSFKAKRGDTIVEGSMSPSEGLPLASVLNDIVPHTGAVVDAVMDGFPAKAAGILPGDKIVRLRLKHPKGKRRLLDWVGLYKGTVRNWDDVIDAVSESQGEPLLLAYVRDGRDFVQEITPMYTDQGTAGRIGISSRRRKVLRRYGFLKSVGKGFEKSYVNVMQVYLTIRGLLTRRVAGKNVGGIVAIAQASYYKAKEGFTEFLYLLAIISLNLAVLNALPIPVLDGGHLVFVLIEKLKGSPVSERIQGAANYVGLALLLSLVAFAMCMDIIRLQS